MNTPVSFEVAKLLKEKGYKSETPKGYYKHGDVRLLLWIDSENYNNQEDFLCVAPTIAEVVMWLYEKHGVWITACIVADSYFSYWLHNKNRALQDTKSNWLTPTEAYEAAIEYCLTNLIK